jgi:hypothetical protein
MQNLSAPRSNAELRAPKTAGIRGDRDAPAAGPQAPLMRDLPWGKRGGLIRGSTSLSSDGSQPELLRLPRSSRRKHKLHRLASPRSASKKETGSSCHVPYPKHFTTLVRICRSICKKNSKRIQTELAEYSLGTSELQHPFSMQKLPTHKTSILTGS